MCDALEYHEHFSVADNGILLLDKYVHRSVVLSYIPAFVILLDHSSSPFGQAPEALVGLFSRWYKASPQLINTNEEADVIHTYFYLVRVKLCLL